MKKLKIYTDGSHSQGSNKMGYGMCFIDPTNQQLYRFSAPVDQEAFGKMYGGEEISNPTLELMAVVKTLNLLQSLNAHDITIISDYNGVQKWMNGTWKPKKSWIVDLVKWGNNFKSRLEDNGCSVKFEWIKAHSGDLMNDLADKLAKDSDKINEFGIYVRKMKKDEK